MCYSQIWSYEELNTSGSEIHQIHQIKEKYNNMQF